MGVVYELKNGCKIQELHLPIYLGQPNAWLECLNSEAKINRLFSFSKYTVV